MSGSRRPQGEPPLSVEDLRRFCDFLYVRTGMMFGESKRYYVERRLDERLEATGSRTMSAYLARLRSDPEEAVTVVNSFTVNETYFYREDHQFRCLSEDILPEVIRNRTPGDRIRLWSQPCSTGEEAYSIALWLLENWRMVDAYNVEIVGSDVDTDALAAARAGRYGPRALSRLPEAALEAYFEPARRHTREIIKDLRESVSFTEANLVDAASMAAQGRFEAIFCRNVLIYFDDASRARAADNLYAALAPGGFLLLGHSESFRLDERFELRRLPNAIVYQRPYSRTG